MISVTELRAGTVFKDSNQYYLVVSYQHIKMGRGSGTVKVKVKNLTNGANLEKSFITGAKVEDVQLERRRVRYLYGNNKLHLMDMNTFEQFEIDKAIVSNKQKYLKEGLEILLFLAENKPLYVEVPKIVEYKVVQTGGLVKGTSVAAAYKDAVLENGLTIKVPLFIKEGDVIRVNTESGEYSERAK